MHDWWWTVRCGEWLCLIWSEKKSITVKTSPCPASCNLIHNALHFRVLDWTGTESYTTSLGPIMHLHGFSYHLMTQRIWSAFGADSQGLVFFCSLIVVPQLKVTLDESACRISKCKSTAGRRIMWRHSRLFVVVVFCACHMQEDSRVSCTTSDPDIFLSRISVSRCDIKCTVLFCLFESNEDENNSLSFSFTLSSTYYPLAVLVWQQCLPSSKALLSYSRQLHREWHSRFTESGERDGAEW